MSRAQVKAMSYTAYRRIKLDDRCDISGAIVVDGDMHVDRIDGGSRTIVVMKGL